MKISIYYQKMKISSNKNFWKWKLSWNPPRDPSRNSLKNFQQYTPLAVVHWIIRQLVHVKVLFWLMEKKRRCWTTYLGKRKRCKFYKPSMWDKVTIMVLGFFPLNRLIWATTLDHYKIIEYKTNILSLRCHSLPLTSTFVAKHSEAFRVRRIKKIHSRLINTALHIICTLQL